jgi:two-component system repressor protein LuxO
LKSFAKEERKAFRSISPDAETMIAAYSWPGNVRQLQNAIRNAVVLHDGVALERGMLPPQLLRATPRAASGGAPSLAPLPTPAPPPPPEPLVPAPAAPEPTPFRMPEPPHLAPPPPEEPPLLTMKEIERRSILAALRHTNRDVPRAAAVLEINPSTIYRRIITWREEGTLPPEFD